MVVGQQKTSRLGLKKAALSALGGKNHTCNTVLTVCDQVSRSLWSRFTARKQKHTQPYKQTAGEGTGGANYREGGQSPDSRPRDG